MAGACGKRRIGGLELGRPLQVGQGKPVADAVRAIGVTEATYYRWRAEYGGLKLDQVKRLKVLEQENGLPPLGWRVC